MDGIRNNVAIVGVGEINGQFPEKGDLQLNAEALMLAMEDAGLKRKDLDGLVTCYSIVRPDLEHAVTLMERLQWFPEWNFSMQYAGTSSVLAIEHAALAIAAGLCNTVAVMFGDNRRTGLRGRGDFLQTLAVTAAERDWEAPYGHTIPACFAMMFQRHHFEYGTTREQLAVLPVVQRKHASMHPLATRRDLITVEDVLKAPVVAEPLGALDMSIVSDCMGAVIVTSSERARDLGKPPVYLLGVGEGVTHENISQAPVFTTLGSKLAGERAYRMAGITPKDIDVAELYDASSALTLITLADYGFCKPEEAGSFIASRQTELGVGKTPVNTHGGHLSFAGAGIFHITEAVRQLRGEAGQRQVKNAKLALATGTGGMAGLHAALILGKEKA